MGIQATKNLPLDMNKWREIIKEWNKSGENQKTYCQRLGLNLNTFIYARSKLREPKQSKKPQFVSLTVKNDEEKLSASSIILENPRGYKLYLSASLSLDQLMKVFKLSGWNHA